MFLAFGKMFSSFLYVLFLCSVYAHQCIMADTLCDLIDIQYVKYNIQCREVFCEGPLQYCSDDNVCLYCNLDLCQSQTPPNQCQPLCKNLQLMDFKERCDEMVKQRSNSTKDIESDMQGYCLDIYHLSAICTLPVVVAIIIIFTASRLWKRYRNGKNTAFGADNHLDQCCCYHKKGKQEVICQSEEMRAICVPSGK